MTNRDRLAERIRHDTYLHLRLLENLGKSMPYLSHTATLADNVEVTFVYNRDDDFSFHCNVPFDAMDEATRQRFNAEYEAFTAMVGRWNPDAVRDRIRAVIGGLAAVAVACAVFYVVVYVLGDLWTFLGVNYG